VKLTLHELMELTQGSLLQQGLMDEYTGMASLDEASELDISFLGNQKYFSDFLKTKAGVVLVPPDLPDVPENVTLVEVENPSSAFGMVVEKLSIRSRSIPIGIHPSAIVADDVIIDREKVCVRAGAIIESGCEIGNGSEIGSGVVIGEHVKIGEDCILHANSTVREHSILGDRVILQPGCVIGADGYGYDLVDGRHCKIDQVGIVVLENDVEVGANATVDRARFGKTLVGEGSKVDNLVQIAHNVQIGKHCLLVSQCGIAGSTKLGNYVTVAGQVGIAGHLEIGDKAVLSALTGVSKSLEGGQVYMGFPVYPVKEAQRRYASISRLPKALVELRELRKEVEELKQS